MLLAVFVCVCACAGGPVAPHYSPIEVKVLQRWRVFDDRRLVGILVRPAVGAERWYRVETPGGGFVGDVSESGHVFKCEPFTTELRALGMFPMREGLRLLFDLRERPTILPPDGMGEPTEAAALELLQKAMDADKR